MKEDSLRWKRNNDKRKGCEKEGSGGFNHVRGRAVAQRMERYISERSWVQGQLESAEAACMKASL